MREDKFERDMERLAEARRITQARMQQQQQRIDERFERMQQRLERKFGRTSSGQQRIVTAALELLLQDGLEALTLRNLAAKLDMRAPALYWHFKNKEQLIDFMAEAILRQGFGDSIEQTHDTSWQDWLTDHMKRLRKAMLAYPDGGRVVAGAHLYPAVTLANLSEVGIATVYAGGISHRRARNIVMTAVSYTFGYVIEEQSSPTAEEAAEMDVSVFLESYPNLARSLDEEDRTEHARDEDYAMGLGLIIAGVTAKE